MNSLYGCTVDVIYDNCQENTTLTGLILNKIYEISNSVCDNSDTD
jgi:hypothetical protein